MKAAPIRSIVTGLLLLALPCVAQSPSATQRDTAFQQEQQGQLEEAAATWHLILQKSPSDPEAYAHLGLLEARHGHYKQALPLYQKALQLDPKMPGLQLNLALAYFKSGELRPAAQIFSALLDKEAAGSPESQRLTALLGIADYGVGDYSDAIPHLKAAAANDSANLQYRLLLAHSCLYAREFQCVLDTYKEILTLNAESAEADMLAGEALDEMHNHAGAIEQFRSAVKADAREPNVHFGLGYLLWTQNQFEEAGAEFRAELRNVPGNAQAMALLADCEMQLNQPDDAKALLERALKADPGLPHAHLDLGILDAEENKSAEAIQELKTAGRLSPNDPAPHWRLARLYQSMGKKQEAQAEFEKTSSLHKVENDTLFSKLKAAQEKGKPSEGGGQPPASQQ